MSSKETIKAQHYIEYMLVRFLRGLLLVMPVDIASFLMGKAWRLIGPLNVRHQRVLRHMEWAFGDEYALAERQRFARDMWENIGRTFAEGLISDRLLQDKSRFKFDEELFRIWNDECTDGALLITHHFGNWELSCAPTVLFSDRKVMGIYKRVKNPLVEKFFLQQRSILFRGGLFSQEHGAARKTIQYLKAGYNMAMVADLRDLKGLPVCFFNMPTYVTSFPAVLAVKFQKPVFVAQLRRTQGAHFMMDIEKLDIELTGDNDRDIQVVTQAIHAQFENWIRQTPSQWMWAPYRWAGRREGKEKPQSWKQFVKSR